MNTSNVEDWGYVYQQNDGSWSEPISLIQFNRNSIIDPRQTFYRKVDGSPLKLKGYVTYNGEMHFGEPKEFQLNYPTTTSLTLTGCSFQGTTTDEIYKGRMWKYKSTFHFDYTALGAYWLKVGVEELGGANSGWEGWQEELEHQMVDCVDGPNGTTVNYYYNDKDFFGEYKVRLIGKDTTNGNNCQTDGYVTFNYKDNQFVGCTFYPNNNTARSHSNKTSAEEANYETTINIIY